MEKLTARNYYDYLPRLGANGAESKKTRFIAQLGGCVKPSFMIIGAQKAGTSALHAMLSKNESIEQPMRKEVHYFDVDELYNSMGVDYYHSFFPRRPIFKKLGLKYTTDNGQLTFESTPDYLYHPKAAERIFAYNPNIKLIVVLRDPSQRAYSGWNMYRSYENHKLYSHQFETRSFGLAISDEMKVVENEGWYDDPRGYVRRGLYARQLKLFLTFFDRTQLLVLNQKELKNNAQGVVEKVCDFLSIAPNKVDNEQIHKRTYEEPYPNEILDTLSEFYEPHNRDLFDLLGFEINW
ncbi:MAG: sulfotransferase domain-containing protein [Flavobacteriales bacterium]